MEFQLVVLRGRSATTAVKLGDGIITAGRHDDCQLRIKSSEVSRRHCQFFEKNGMLLVKDMGSSNGTLLNGKRIEGQRVLEPGDELTIGPVKLRVEKLGQAAPAADQAAAGASGPRPGDTAVPAPMVTPGAASDEFEIDFDDMPEPSSEEMTVAVKPDAKAKVAAPAPAAAPKPAEPTASAKDEHEIADDAIADFLLDLKIDDED